MQKAVRYVLAPVIVILAGIQLVPVNRDNPPVEGEVPAPPAVRTVLRESCYDCHSNETVWPWYSRVAPVSWLVAQDVEKGRGKLNFSTWSAYDSRRRDHKLHEVLEEVDEGKMPLPKYLRLHPEARLTPEDLAILHDWVQTVAPEDSSESGRPDRESRPGSD